MNEERPIEKLLRRAAQKRSAESGPAPELHPANRRLLQAEVAQQFPKVAPAPPASTPTWWARLQQRWVYGVAAFAALWIVALAIVPLFSKTKSQPQLALNSIPEPAAAVAVTDPAHAIAPATVAAAKVVTESEELEPLAVNSVQSAPPMTAPMVAQSPSSTAKVLANHNREAFSRPATAAPAVHLADRTAALRQKSPEERGENKYKQPLVGAAQNEAAPARDSLSAASVTQSRSGGERLVRAESQKIGAVPAPALGKLESTRGHKPAPTKEEFASAKPAEVYADAVASAVAFAGNDRVDKPRLARDGSEEKTQPERSSQAYSNLLSQRSARAKDLEDFRNPPKVLAKFRIEQAGRDMRVVDGDGSVYSGVLDTQNTLYQQLVQRQNLNLSNTYDSQFRFHPPKLTTAAPTSKTPAETYYFFRVEGTNRTLQQKVVFTWNFVATNAPPGAANYNGGISKLDAAKLTTPFSNLLQNSTITGRAQLGANREIEVNATPVSR